VKRSASAIAIDAEYTITRPMQASSVADQMRPGSSDDARRAGL